MRSLSPSLNKKEEPLILRLLTPKRKFDSATLESLRESRLRENSTLEELLIRRKMASDLEIATLYAEYYMIPMYAPGPDELTADAALGELLPEKLCRDHIVAPASLENGVLDVCFFTPNELFLVDELQLLTGLNVRPLFAPLSAIERILSELYEESQWSNLASESQTAFEEIEDSMDGGSDGEGGEVIHLDQPPPPGRDGRIIRYVNQIFEQALRSRASDVHIEPFEGRCRVRLRVDGRLNEIAPPPISMLPAIVSRIKVLAKMDIAEKRIPQDGAIALRSEKRRVDLRVNTRPTVHGEKVVMRVLDKDAIPLDLIGLGLSERQEKDLSESIQMPHGLMLVTGPTGSGKSTTLYACLNHLNAPDVNICTVEDPVEYKFMGINQVQTRAQIGLDFASALRAFLRQDPDVMMVGEVRDRETAQICLRAALTGHFVLSTLHTNDAVSAVSRLEDMDVEPFLLASTLRVIVAQRLVRRLCEHCRQVTRLETELRARYKIPEGAEIHQPTGCKECRETGYRGRMGAFEVIRITPDLAQLIQTAQPATEMRKLVQRNGTKLLGESAMELVCQGATSLQEAISVQLAEV